MSIKATALHTEKMLGGYRGERCSGGIRLVSLAHLISVQNRAIPTADEYQKWFDGVRSPDPRAKSPITGAKLRRAVQMVRNGCSQAEISRAIGTNATRWLKMLPPELAA